MRFGGLYVYWRLWRSEMEFILRIAMYFLMIVFPLLLLRLILKTNSLINDWAIKKDFDIIKKYSIHWERHGVLAFKYRLFNFIVIAENSSGQISKYSIRGIRSFLNPKSLKIKRIN